ncbi:MAG: helix-turn-helix transcriptional regulator, partial [Planctomycetes bacterium]|nr:helix-turn-helix transcriptional regulator [Planctomycetota bacterium]
MPTRIDDYSVGLLARLKKAAGDTPLAEVARRTGTPFASLHRYFHGTRVPAEFLAAFARAFDVNPAWLMHGEGAPLLADVSAANARLGGDLLELVEAMNAVTHMRLGALTGKHHLKVLRELSEAMQRYGELRTRLDRQSSPIFRDLLVEFHKALRSRQLDRAAELRRALDQVSRLSGNEDLLETFESLQGLQAHLERDLPTGIAFHRRSMVRAMAKTDQFNRQAAEHGTNFVVALRDYGRMEEAVRFSEAMACLLRGRDDCRDVAAWLEGFAGAIEADLLRVGNAVARVSRVLPGIMESLRRESAGMWVRPALWSGAMRFDEALDWGNNLPRKTRFVARFACWLEDTRALETVLDRFVADEPLKLHPAEADARHAARLLAALRSQPDPDIAAQA